MPLARTCAAAQAEINARIVSLEEDGPCSPALDMTSAPSFLEQDLEVPAMDLAAGDLGYIDITVVGDAVISADGKIMLELAFAVSW